MAMAGVMNFLSEGTGIRSRPKAGASLRRVANDEHDAVTVETSATRLPSATAGL